MILVADSGSTKTEWALASDRPHVVYLRTAGYNPYFDTLVSWTGELAGWLKQQRSRQGAVERVYYYGAGCDSRVTAAGVHKVLEDLLPGAAVKVEDDLAGAARALFGREKGVALILGTGTHAGVWTGDRIMKKMLPMGYLLGDHGSGAALGLRFLRAWLDKELPEDVAGAFRERYGLDREQVKKKVYLEARPNYYLASFAPFILEHAGIKAVYKMVRDEFERLFRGDLLPLLDASEVREVRATGSVAWYGREILKEVAGAMGVKTGRFLQFPLKELVNYHLRHPEET